MSIRRATISIAVVCAAPYLSGCASLVTGQDQLVAVTTPNCPGAACTLRNEEGTFYVHQTPGSVSVDREYGDLIVTCSKPGHAPFSMNVSSSTKGMAWGNILLGGGIGAAVDMGTGAAYDYPPEIIVPLDCRSPAEIAAAPKSGSHDVEAAKFVNLNACESPKFVLNDESGEIYKSRCQDGNVAVMRCKNGECSPLSVVSKADDGPKPDKGSQPILPKHAYAASRVARDEGCTESMLVADVTSNGETWMAKCNVDHFILIDCGSTDCTVRK